MKNKILTIIIIWLIVATATTFSVAFIYNDKKNRISEEMAAKIVLDKREKEATADAEKLKNSEKIDSPLRSTEEILTDLDQSMEKIIFDEN